MALSLDDIIDIKVNITKATTTGRKFDLLLLLGETDVFSDRIKIYKDTYSMLQDGFSNTDRLYKACQLAFAQSQHPDRIAIGRIEDIIIPNTAEEGQILLANALQLNADAEVGKYIYHSEGTPIDEYRLSNTAVDNGQLIVSNTIPENEIRLADALELNAEAEVGKYIYPSVIETHYFVSNEYVDNTYKMIVSDTPGDEGRVILSSLSYSESSFATGEYAKVEAGKYVYTYFSVSETQENQYYKEIVSNSDTPTSEQLKVSTAQYYNSEVTDSDIGKYIDTLGQYYISDTEVSGDLAECRAIVSAYPVASIEITLSAAQLLNPNVDNDDIHKFLYYDSENTETISEGGYAISDTAVGNDSRLIVSAYPHNENEIILSMATLLNQYAEVGKYIYHYQEEGTASYELSATEVEGSELIVPNNTTRKETIEEALTACRAENDEFYIVNICKDNMTDEEHIAAGQFCETCNPSAIYAFTTDSAATLTLNENIFTKLKALDLKRTIGQYSTKHQDSIVAILSWALKLLSSNNANSAFTLKDKIEEGVTPETNVTSMNVKTLKENNGNIYVNRNGFTLFEDGKMANGDFFDEVAFLDKYKERMQINIIREMQSQNKIKQTEDGMAILKAKITEVCEEMYANGFIDSGIWKAEPVLNLKTGDTLSNGYYIQSESIDEQSQSDREARIAPPIYVSLKLAGAIHYLTIQIDVNR